MSRKRVVLVTGANGEMGHGLIHKLAERDDCNILALDVRELEDSIKERSYRRIVGDVLDQYLLGRLVSEFEIDTIFHLAALLSTRAEFTPETAHDVNVQGTLNLLRLAVEQSRWHGRKVKFLFPSSIAVYGMPNVPTKNEAGRVMEEDWNMPTTMYGCNKLYCEHLGRYYAQHYQQLAVDNRPKGVDFRSIRFPGLISAFTAPSGGTSDYAPEMVHAAAQGEKYDAFVRPDTQISFMAMPDAITALLGLMDAPEEALSSHVYNITAYAPTAEDFASKVKNYFPDAQIGFAPDKRRQGIVDSWPADVDDSRARKDWDFNPQYDLDRTFEEYLMPNIIERYRK